MKRIRTIAIVLPQFHPIPENDEWWGKGFTEWTNVAKAKPLFKDHYQPHIPSDLGFYDLRLQEAREAQAKIAKDHGIHGFCYYHYWFNGKRLLDKPIDEILQLKKPDMPFMLCWANENWTRRWDGLENDILIKQDYSFEDDQRHMRWLCEKVFPDERYIRVYDKPVFVIYRDDLFPDIKRTLRLWRNIAEEEYGFKGLYLCAMESFNRNFDPEEIGFDACIEFSPHHLMKYLNKPKKKIPFPTIWPEGKKYPRITDFRLAAQGSIDRELPGYKVFRSVTPSWDNTPRKGENGVIGKNSSPSLFMHWLKSLKQRFQPYSEEENFIFINAMNEWAEGNHLEPCLKYGTRYLEATKKALQD
ncbi:glycosyltransferase WbsX family protein [Salinimicrobium terrae]|uniref:glycosyltransferase WbsX family protein n=1 Tax=Salinimicrobium terrae TaxID=470866 RepID=UPI0004244567|nr:glycoside hydrolase family 99-like domain-containing protein [Salinimicrobium terrae]